MKKFYSTPIAEGTPFDNEDNAFQSDNVQDAIEEAKISGLPFNEIDCGLFLTDRIFKAYNAESGQTITGTKSTIVLMDITSDSDVLAFNLSSGELEFLVEGTYNIVYNVTYQNTNGTRSTTRTVLELNSGSGFNEVPGTEIYTYERNVANDRSTGTSSALLTVNVGDIVRIQAEVFQGSNNTTLDEGCGLLIIPQKQATEIDAMLTINGEDITKTEILSNYDAGEL